MYAVLAPLLLVVFAAPGVQPLLAQPAPIPLPACSAPGQELAYRRGFVLCHSTSLRVPVWTAHVLTPVRRQETSAPRPRHFRRDHGLNSPGAADSDYRHSGFARGHLVPAADLAGDAQAVSDAFLLSNAIPQDARLNSGKWRVLENTIRRLASASGSAVVYTGPVFCEGFARIGANRVAVPCELFKVAFIGHGIQPIVLAAVLPNDHNPTEPLSAFLTTVAEVERRTGLTFTPPAHDR